MRRLGGRWSAVLRLAVTSAFLGVVFWRVSVADTIRLLGRLDWTYYSLAFLLVLVGVVVSAYKWHLLLDGLGIRIAPLRLTKVYFIGVFFSGLLPTTIGGDVVRVERVSRGSERFSEVVTSVFVERLSGYLALLVIGAVSAVVAWLSFRQTDVSLAALGSGVPLALLVAALSLLWVLGLARRVLPRLSGWGVFARIEGFLQRAVVSLRTYAQQRRLILTALALSVLFQAMAVLASLLVARALDIHVSSYYFWFLVPLVMVATLMPISINGLGVREGASVALWTQAGMSSSEALAFAFMVYLLTVAAGLAGAGFYLLDDGRPLQRPAHGAAEEAGTAGGRRIATPDKSRTLSG